MRNEMKIEYTIAIKIVMIGGIVYAIQSKSQWQSESQLMKWKIEINAWNDEPREYRIPLSNPAVFLTANGKKITLGTLFFPTALDCTLPSSLETKDRESPRDPKGPRKRATLAARNSLFSFRHEMDRAASGKSRIDGPVKAAYAAR